MTAPPKQAPELIPPWVTPYDPCPKCGRPKPAGDSPHAPRLTNGGRVDCAGDRIPDPEPRR
jgi:hypothetical protein